MLGASLLIFLSCDPDGAALDFSGVDVELRLSPQVIRAGEAVEITWETSSSLETRLDEVGESAFPDATQPWTCRREEELMVCQAPRIPEDANGWDCGPDDCRRPFSNDAAALYRPRNIGEVTYENGSDLVYPDVTSSYRLCLIIADECHPVAWAQVVVVPEGEARIDVWTAWPSPALRGEPVSLTYVTHGCDAIELAAFPPLGSGELTREAGSDDEGGRFFWEEATQSRDFYLGCHPIAEDSSVRIRSRIFVEVVDWDEW